jgi:Flp pilus assembly protein TadG
VPRSSRNRPRGQVLVLFVLALLVIIAAVGLIIDGGFAYSQRRAEQNAADFAALAGSDALLNGHDPTAAALAAAAQNGYTHGAGGVTVTVTTTSKTVKVDVSAPHSNYFLGAVGQPTWQVSVTATALAGVGTKFLGVAPFILSQDVFDPVTGLPYANYADASHPVDFTKTTGSGSDAPLTLTNLAWTNLGTGNVSSNDVKNALDGSAPINAELLLNQYIGQHNNGVHNDLFDTNSPNQPSINTTLAGQNVILPIVGPPIAGQTHCFDASGSPDSHTVGCFRGWAMFHVVSATKRGGGDDGTITGYFMTGITRSASVEDVCAITDTACLGTFHGTYIVKLIN